MRPAEKNCATLFAKKYLEAKSMEWIKVQEVHCDGTWLGYTEYVSADGTMGKHVWFDGYEEIYEIEK